MHIVNIMFSAIAGGIEQAFVDYCEGLQKRGHTVTPVTHPQAVVNRQLRALGLTPVSLRNVGEQDFIAKWRLRRKIARLKPDVAISHTSRSFALAKPATKGLCPLVGVAHNYNSRARRLSECDAVFATTHDLMRFVAGKKNMEDRMYLIPNMVRCNELPSHSVRKSPPVIGSMGRFVKKKGFDMLIDALEMLKARGYIFKAIIGGEGEEEKALKKRAKAAGLKDIVSFPGWVDDKKEFYSNIDIFCLPSHHEPFGIVLLEAFTYGTPVIATNSEGPLDILTPNFDALMVNKDSASDMAGAIARLLENPVQAASLASNGFVKAKTIYSIESVSERIEKALEKIVAKWKTTQESAQ